MLKNILSLLLMIQGCALFGPDEYTIRRVSAPGDDGEHVVAQGSYASPLDVSLSKIARKVPGFGGYYFDKSGSKGNLNIFLLNPNQEDAEKVRAELAGVLSLAAIANASVRPVQGQYDYRQLTEWYDDLMSGIWALNAVTAVDIDESINRLGVGIGSKRARSGVKARINELGVPTAAVEIFVLRPSKRSGSEC